MRREIPDYDRFTDNLFDGRVPDVFGRLLAADEFPETFRVEVRCAIYQYNDIIAKFRLERAEQGDAVFGGQRLLTPRIEAFALVRYCAQNCNAVSRSRDLAGRIRTGRKPSTSANRLDWFMMQVDG